MSVGELFIMAVALAMDAFAVSVCKGLASSEKYLKTGLVCGLWFGSFQALMPFLGWLLGSTVAEYVRGYSAYIAFALLMFLGIKMIASAAKELAETKKALAEGIDISRQSAERNTSLAASVMIVFAVATSIDALAAGLSLAAVNADIAIAVSFIGTVAFLFSFVGAAVGARIGERAGAKAEIAGGAILCILGIKILAEYFLR